MLTQPALARKNRRKQLANRAGPAYLKSMRNRAFLVVLVAALVVPPAALAQQVYVPSMGPPSQNSVLPTTRNPQVYVPEMGPPKLRLPGPIEAPPVRRYPNRNATVPSPTPPYAGRIEVPDRVRQGETSQDRVQRCQNYASVYGVPNADRGSYIARCAY